jgi:predicted regulator of Ras-like GTPase activity (Roadblock/LC7/MglB family)
MKNLVENVPGADGCILADWEGEAVEGFCLYDDFSLKVIAAHCGILHQHLKIIHSTVRDGTVNEVVLATDTRYLIVGAIGNDYSIVLTLDRNRSILGYALRKFRLTVAQLYGEIY